MVSTSDTATRKVDARGASTAPRRESAAGGWVRGMRFSAFSLIMMALVILAVMVLAPTVQSWVAQRQQISTLQEQKADLQAQVRDLTGSREQWTDSTYIVTQARERLDYVMPGEVSFLVINDLPSASAATEPAPVSKKLQATKGDWMHSLFASAMTAGLAPVEKAPEGTAK